jgi:energy-coupling factor transporter ATP-binding protein EcfA2
MAGFVKATKKKLKARVALIGPTGSGKTMTALKMARGFAGSEGRIAVIDTEHGSASKYSGDVADFDVLELTSYEPSAYIDAIYEAASCGYSVVIVDSLSHAWMGEGGILDQKDKAGGKFDAWRNLTPQQNDLVKAIVAAPLHVIATMRAKMEYLVEKDDRGKTSVTKVGLAPVQRDGLEYEFDVIGEINVEHTMHITKSRCAALADQRIRKPGDDVAAAILAWLNDGEADEPRIVKMIAAAEGGQDLANAKAEIHRVAKMKMIDRAAYDRLVEAWKAREADLMRVNVEKEGMVA